jgi:hypothetical protein
MEQVECVCISTRAKGRKSNNIKAVIRIRLGLIDSLQQLQG